ncbi:MAG: hypothetical protein LCH26_06420 [Proteobacteria bacterium]|nr:hypothetical protein [Pseudomonadota bacterium]
MQAVRRLIKAGGIACVLIHGGLWGAKAAPEPKKALSQKETSATAPASSGAPKKALASGPTPVVAPKDASVPLDSAQGAVSSAPQTGPKSLAEIWSAVKVFSITQDQNQEKIALEWTVPTEMALFVRGRRVFMIFSQKANFDLTHLDKASGLWHDFQVLPLENGCGFCLTIADDVKVHYGRRETAWTLRLEEPDFGRDQNIAEENPETGKEYVTSLDTQVPPQVEVALETPLKSQTHPVSLVDPLTKDVIVVVPAPRRQIDPRNFEDFDILPSLRGLVLLKKADTFAPQVTEKDIVVLSPRVSPMGDRQTARKKAIPPAPVDATMWQVAAKSEKHIRKLYNEGRFEGDNADHKQFISDHKELALSLMAEGDIGDALNVLEYLDIKEPTTLKDPLVRLLRAIAHVELGQADMTQALLQEKADEGEEHAILWQGVADMMQEHYHEGLKKTVERLKYLKEYPQAVTNPVYLLMALASYRINYPGLLFLKLIDQSRLIPFEKDLYNYLYLFLAPRTPEHDNMVEKFAKKAKSIQVRAEATFALVAQNKNKWDAQTQIQHLEDVRFLWRGNSLEMNIAATLADLYAKENQPDKALFLYRMIKEQFEDLPGVAALVQKGENYFCDAFMDRKKRPLFMTVALYDRFKEMLPAGPRQVQVIEQLSKDYETLGFYTQAQRSLQYLIQKSSENPKKAQFLLKLSQIQEKISDMKGLESTLTQLKALPPDPLYDAKVRYLEADYLAKGGHKAEALALLGNDATYEGLKHRLHIAWDMSNWSLVRTLLTQLIAHKEATPSDQNKFLLNLAVTLNVMKDRQGLHLLRTSFLARMEKTPQGTLFDLLTLAPLETPSEATKQAFQEQLAKVQKFQDLLSKLAANPDSAA